MRPQLALVAFAAFGLSACNHPEADPRTLPTLVAVTSVGAAGTNGPGYTGVVRARVESSLGFRVAGKVIERLVDAGQSVRRGQPLMRLDPADLALAASAQKADVAAAQARFLQADADLKRSEGLVETGAVSAQAYDQVKAAADSARAQLAAAKAQADVGAHNLDYAVLKADADGVVQETGAEPGQVVSAGQVVVRLAHAGPREAQVFLPETLHPAIGAQASARLYGRDDQAFAASLRQLSQSADPVTRTYDARYVLSGAGGQAPLGATVTVTLPGAGGGARHEAPLGAIYDPGSGPGVWRLVGDRVRFQPVRLLALGADTATVSGVDPGERIVALGADRLREGQQVRTTPLPGAAATREARQ